jgi:hypothetical protein
MTNARTAAGTKPRKAHFAMGFFQHLEAFSRIPAMLVSILSRTRPVLDLDFRIRATISLLLVRFEERVCRSKNEDVKYECETGETSESINEVLGEADCEASFRIRSNHLQYSPKSREDLIRKLPERYQQEVVSLWSTSHFLSRHLPISPSSLLVLTK